MNKAGFAQWLENHANLKAYSIGRYANTIDKVSSELGEYGLPKVNLFSTSDTAFIDIILNNPEFLKKNAKGNRMFSTALKYFKTYMEYFNDKEFQAELSKEEVDYERSITKNIAQKYIKVNIVDKPQDKPKHRIVNNKKIWSRNPKFASEAIAHADYLCEFESQHNHFISKFSQRNYVEAHHLVPIKYQADFDCSLDIHANIVSLCLVCHKKIHFGFFEDKKAILDKLFNSRRERLNNGEIYISIDDLYSYYQN